MEKIKLLSNGKKKAKPENPRNWAKTVERYAPEMYKLSYAAGKADALKQTKELLPEIILILPSILQDNLTDGLQLLKEIKQVHPRAAVFINMGMIDDEQEAFDAYLACGAYKCYSAPISMDALFHDMYVALNLE